VRTNVQVVLVRCAGSVVADRSPSIQPKNRLPSSIFSSGGVRVGVVHDPFDTGITRNFNYPFHIRDAITVWDAFAVVEPGAGGYVAEMDHFYSTTE